MKRHPALIPLSHDHHQALFISQRLRHASAESTAELTAAFLGLWESEERLHFRAEEELLLPAYAAHGDPEHPLLARVLLDHVMIRRDVERVRSAPSVQLLHELGRRLADHIRLEERELFVLVERTIPEPELEALGDRLRAAVRARPGRD